MSGRRAHGFTLLELMTVVFIIMVLVGIGVALGPAIAGRGSDQLTRSVLSVSESVLTEYHALTGSWPDVTTNDWYAYNRFGWDTARDEPGEELWIGNRDEFRRHSIERFVAVTLQTTFASRDDLRVQLREGSSINAMYEGLGGDQFRDADEGDGNDEGLFGFMELYDGWGNRIVYVPSRSSITGPHDDPARREELREDWLGRLDQPVEARDGYATHLPLRDTPYFASPGPSGEFGNIHAAPGTQEYEDAQDNIYSFELAEQL